MDTHSKKRHRVSTKTSDGRLSFDSSWGALGSGDGQFKEPSGIAVGMNGAVYVTDSDNHRIQCFDREGVFIRKWGTQGTGNGEFNYPYGLAIGLCDGIHQSIMDAMRVIPELYGFPPGLLPICVAYVGDECIAVTEEENNRIQVFNTNGRFIRKWGTYGREDGQFRIPTGCCIDPSGGILYVADSLNHRIHAFNLDGTFICKWGSYGSGDGQLLYPGNISITTNGLIYVCNQVSGNQVSGRISCFTSQGVYVRHIHIDDIYPSSILLNEIDDTIYVCDLDNHCIYHYRLDDTLVDTFILLDSHVYPRAITGAANGLIYVTDLFNNRIVRLRH